MSGINKPKHRVIKEFGLTSLAVNNRTTVFVLTAIIFIMGIVSYNSMPKENFPEIKMPTIYVGTVYPGNSPLDVEDLITRPIEKQINTISGVDNIKSTSIQDYSTIVVEFGTDVIVEEALQDVKDAVDKAKAENKLPNDLETDPNIFELNFSEFPIMNLNLSGEFSIDKLNEYAEYLEDEIEKLGEISKVEIRGVQNKEVQINIDLHRMESLDLSFRDVEGAIANENVTISGGSYLSNGNRRTIRVVGQFSKIEDFKKVVVKHEFSKIVYLGDIADVKYTDVEPESFARLEGENVVMLDVIKRAGGNLIEASNKIDAVVAQAQKDLFPKNLSIVKTNDQSTKTIDQVANLENSIISGVILVVLVLLFFLGLRNALFVGVAIPLSMFLSFFILSSMGITINMVVLFGLIMALGMLVDNGIVVVENVYRLMDEGYDPITAAKEGVGEVAWPIIASTATTLAAFLPLAMWPGMMGEFMKYLPITLMVVLGSSLFVALVVNPVLTAVYMKVEEKPTNAKRLIKGLSIFFVVMAILTAMSGASILIALNLTLMLALIIFLNKKLLTPMANKFQVVILPKLEERYAKSLATALRGHNAKWYFLGTIGMLIGAFMLLGIFTPKVLFFPENQPNYVNIFMEYPIGADIMKTNKFSKMIEKKLDGIIEEHQDVVESVVSQVGAGTSDPNDPSSAGGGANPNKARIQVNFKEFKFRNGKNTSDILEQIRSGLGKFPGVTVTVDKNKEGPPAGKPINIEVTGPEYSQLIKITEDLKREINNSGVEGIEELKTDLVLGKPELLIDVDRVKARMLGISTAQIGMEIRNSLFGKEVSKFKDGEDDYPIMLRLSEEYRHSPDALLNQHVIFRSQSDGQIKRVPLSAVATARNTSTIGAVKRKNLNRVVTLYSNVLEGANPTEINNELKELLADYEVEAGYDFKFTGEQEKQEKEMAFLSQALIMAVFLIFLIIVAQFNRVSAPVIILFSVIFSTIGVFLGLVIFQMDFIIMMTMIGIISLAGIVVNNAIVLLDYTNLVRLRKRAELKLNENQNLNYQQLIEVIIESGKTRLRPVLLTAITTVLGLLPLAVGLNIDFFGLISNYSPDIWVGGDNVIFWGPMSWTIIFGITFATFLTLILVPVMYLLIEKIKIKYTNRTV